MFPISSGDSTDKSKQINLTTENLKGKHFFKWVLCKNVSFDYEKIYYINHFGCNKLLLMQ